MTALKHETRLSYSYKIRLSIFWSSNNSSVLKKILVSLISHIIGNNNKHTMDKNHLMF